MVRRARDQMRSKKLCIYHSLSYSCLAGVCVFILLILWNATAPWNWSNGQFALMCCCFRRNWYTEPCQFLCMMMLQARRYYSKLLQRSNEKVSSIVLSSSITEKLVKYKLFLSLPLNGSFKTCQHRTFPRFSIAIHEMSHNWHIDYSEPCVCTGANLFYSAKIIFLSFFRPLQRPQFVVNPFGEHASPASQRKMSNKKEFTLWLNKKLRELNADENVFGEYIISILEDEETADERQEALEGILSAMIVSTTQNS